MPVDKLAVVNRPVRPEAIAPPAASYELGVVSDAPTRLLHTAGIVGTRPDGTLSSEVGEQAAEVWASIGAILAEAGFEASDIVSYTTYVVAGEDLAPVMVARDAFLGGHRAASTLVTVPALARPQWKVEIAAVAARAD